MCFAFLNGLCNFNSRSNFKVSRLYVQLATVVLSCRCWSEPFCVFSFSDKFPYIAKSHKVLQFKLSHGVQFCIRLLIQF